MRVLFVLLILFAVFAAAESITKPEPNSGAESDWWNTAMEAPGKILYGFGKTGTMGMSYIMDMFMAPMEKLVDGMFDGLK